VSVLLNHGLVAAGPGGVQLSCAYTEREMTLEVDALVLVTARLPNDDLALALAAAEGGPEVRAVGDALAPGTIAAAVWDGRRYAEDLQDALAADGDRVPFRREIIALRAD
jgi:dimethylamine/trimethylamine dehydrogenase